MAETLLALDVGEKRIGVAMADTSIRIAIPYDTIEVDGDEIKNIFEICVKESVKTIVMGFPRSQKGKETAQTDFVREFAKNFEETMNVVYQDESLTSVMAEKRLKERGQNYKKGDIDKEAATIILQDYLEENYG